MIQIGGAALTLRFWRVGFEVVRGAEGGPRGCCTKPWHKRCKCLRGSGLRLPLIP